MRRRLAELPVKHPLPAKNLRACQVEGIANLEESLAAAHPRVLVQMATGARKTYTACSFTCRLIKHAGAKRVLFLVDRADLGRQAMGEFQQFVAPDTGRKFTEVYNVQHLTSSNLDPVARVTICTVQRLYSILRGKRDEDSLTTLAGRLARLDREISREDAKTLSELAGGKSLSQLSNALLNAVNPDKIAEKAAGKLGAEPQEIAPEHVEAARRELVDEACAPFDLPALRDALANAKQDAEQTIDTTTN